METTAQVIAHYETAYISAVRSLRKAEARLGTKGTAETRKAAHERKRRAEEGIRESSTILVGLYKVYNPEGVTFRWDTPNQWTTRLRLRMEEEDRADAEARGAEARASAQPPRGLEA